MRQTSRAEDGRPSPAAAGAYAWAARHRRALAVAGVWALMIAGAQLYAWGAHLSHREALDALAALFHRPVAGPLIFIGVAALCPILLIPAAALGAVGGLAFGPALGILYTLVGCNISGSLAYLAGRLSCGRGAAEGAGALGRAGGLLRRNSFLAIIALRLSFLPFDLVNYAVGAARVPWPTFIVASSIGSLPGIALAVLVGSSII